MHSKIQIDGIDTKRLIYIYLTIVIPLIILVEIMTIFTFPESDSNTFLPIGGSFRLEEEILAKIFTILVPVFLIGLFTIIAVGSASVVYNRFISKYFKLKFVVELNDNIFLNKKDFCIKKIDILSFTKTMLIIFIIFFFLFFLIMVLYTIVNIIGIKIHLHEANLGSFLVQFVLFIFICLVIFAVTIALCAAYYNYIIVNITGGVRFFCTQLAEKPKNTTVDQTSKET